MQLLNDSFSKFYIFGKKVLSSLATPWILVYLLIYAFCLPGNGTIEYEEFVAMMATKVKEKDTEDEIKTAFKVLFLVSMFH